MITIPRNSSTMSYSTVQALQSFLHLPIGFIDITKCHEFESRSGLRLFLGFVWNSVILFYPHFQDCTLCQTTPEDPLKYLCCSNFHELWQGFLYIWFCLERHQNTILQYAVFKGIPFRFEILREYNSHTVFSRRQQQALLLMKGSNWNYDKHMLIELLQLPSSLWNKRRTQLVTTKCSSFP